MWKGGRNLPFSLLRKLCSPCKKYVLEKNHGFYRRKETIINTWVTFYPMYFIIFSLEDVSLSEDTLGCHFTQRIFLWVTQRSMCVVKFQICITIWTVTIVSANLRHHPSPKGPSLSSSSLSYTERPTQFLCPPPPRVFCHTFQFPPP